MAREVGLVAKVVFHESGPYKVVVLLEIEYSWLRECHIHGGTVCGGVHSPVRYTCRLVEATSMGPK